MTNRLVFVRPKDPKNGFHLQQQQSMSASSSSSKPASSSPRAANPSSSSSSSYFASSSTEMEIYPPVGLINTGATCFFNSSLQCLYACPGFVQLLQQHTKPEAKVERDILDLLSLHLSQNVRRLGGGGGKRSGGGGAFSVQPVFKLFRQQSNGMIRTGRQEDSHEALVMLLDQMERALLRSSASSAAKFTPSKNPVSDVFGCTLHRHIVCPQCKYEAKPSEPNVVLSVEIKSGGATAQQLIRSAFASQVMDKDNKWECGGCKKRVQAETFYSFASFPDTLVLHLKRFAVNRMGRQEKLKTSFSIEGSEELAFGAGVKYELVGVLVHQGARTSSGHYYAFVRINKAWYEADDETVRRVSSSTVLKESQAYMLFYARKRENKSAEVHGGSGLNSKQQIQLLHDKPSSSTPVKQQQQQSAVADEEEPVAKKQKTAAVAAPLSPPMGQVPKSVLEELKQSPRIAPAVASSSTIRTKDHAAISPSSRHSARSHKSAGTTTTTTTRTPAKVKRKFAAFTRRRIWDMIRNTTFPFSNQRNSTTTTTATATAAANEEEEVMPPAPPSPPAPPKTAFSSKAQDMLPMESFLPTSFSFDVNKPKRRPDHLSNGALDAWDEHLDRGKLKKQRRH